MGIYGQPGGFGLGGVGHPDVPGLHPDVTMRPPLGAAGLPGLGMPFGSTPVTAGIHDPTVSSLGHGLQDPSLQVVYHPAHQLQSCAHYSVVPPDQTALDAREVKRVDPVCYLRRTWEWCMGVLHCSVV